MKRILSILTLSAALGTGSFTPTAYAAGAKTEGKSLYKRLGGKKAITAVVDEFVGRVAADTRINRFFAQAAGDPARLASFKAKLVAQICEAAGGPCKYKGLDMKAAHKGMGVSGADFGALVEDGGRPRQIQGRREREGRAARGPGPDEGRYRREVTSTGLRRTAPECSARTAGWASSRGRPL